MLHDPGPWWDIIASIPSVNNQIVNGNVLWWKLFCSKYFARKYFQAHSHDQVEPQLPNGITVEDICRLAQLAGITLKSMQREESFKCIDTYVTILSPLAYFLDYIRCSTGECYATIHDGPIIRILNYRHFTDMHRFAQSNSLLKWMINRNISNLPFQPDIIFLSISTKYEFLTALLIANMFRQSNNPKHICISQPSLTNPTFQWQTETIFKNPEFWSYFDSVVCDGQNNAEVLPGLVEHLHSGHQFRGVIDKNVSFKKSIVQANIPFPIVPHSYFSPVDMIMTRLSSPPCHWRKCVFCSHHVIQGTDNSVYVSQADHEFHRILHMYERGLNWFSFSDEAFSPHIALSFSRMVIAHEIKIHWVCRHRLDSSLDSAYWKTLKKAGCVEVFFGLETIVERIQHIMDKYPITLSCKSISSILSRVSSAGLGIHLSLMYGFPGETYDETVANFNFIKNVLQKTPHISYYLNRFALFPNTTIMAQPERFGIIPKLHTGELISECDYVFKNNADKVQQDAIYSAFPILSNEIASATIKQLRCEPAWLLAHELYTLHGHGMYIKAQSKNMFG